MAKIIFVSNLLPVEAIKNENGDYDLQMRIGGISSGLRKFYADNNSIWVGWDGFEKDYFGPEEKIKTEKLFRSRNCQPVQLKKKEIKHYLEGFSNRTLWPLFHYFSEKSIYRQDDWEAYVKVNKKYLKKIEEILENGDKVWIHDYHLMLLPKLLREKYPDLKIGFFLHIPFPSYEVFRLLPWRIEILEGLLGSDLVGFHTYDYERHFMSSVRRLIGLDNYFNQIRIGKRVLKADNFPLGIDYEKFTETAEDISKEIPNDLIDFHNRLENHVKVNKENKIIISIDRLDYTKGILLRLKAFRLFLDKYPQFRGKVSLLLLITAQRDKDEQNRPIKSQLDAMVGKINSEYGHMGWTPIHYFLQKLSFNELVQVFLSSDVALITPIRDGMNLIAKEYIASKPANDGVLIISEMAGASKEMGEAIIVNPNNRNEIADALHFALNMTPEEKIERNKALRKRLSTYTQVKWGKDFIEALDGVKKLQEYDQTRKLSNELSDQVINKYINSQDRMIFLDYDGTLQGFYKNPQDAKPDEELYMILEKLTADERNNIIIISGRDKETLSSWFPGNWKIGFIAEHGVWHKEINSEWYMMEPIDKGWMDIIKSTIQFYVDRTPRSFIEEKNYSLVWHYRDSDPDLGVQRAFELKDELQSLVVNLHLEIMNGDKVIEIKNAGINKGRAALNRMGDHKYDFIMAMGDDWTDEFTFEVMPEEAETIKVGTKRTRAKYYVENFKSIRKFLKDLVN